MKTRRQRFLLTDLSPLLFDSDPGKFLPLPAEKATAAPTGFITFEDGVNGASIESSISGLEFTTTDGFPWIYADWRTGFYNGPYPDGSYTSNGNFFAWLGPSQGDGRIDFTQGGASYFSVWVSCGEAVTLRGYDAYGILDQVTIQPKREHRTDDEYDRHSPVPAKIFLCNDQRGGELLADR